MHWLLGVGIEQHPTIARRPHARRTGKRSGDPSAIVDQEIEYDLDFVHDETGRIAVENTDYRIVERPRGNARKLAKK